MTDSAGIRPIQRFSIGEVAAYLGLSHDTLRYYEKIGLLPRVARDPGGRRRFDERDLSILRFVRRAQAMNFSLTEIAQLLKMRENPRQAKDEVRALTREKLTQTETRLEEIRKLRDELRVLVNLCRCSEAGCPIIESLDEQGIAE